LVLDRKANSNGVSIEIDSEKGVIASLSNVNESETRSYPNSVEGVD
jgi:hypothetical protein